MRKRLVAVATALPLLLGACGSGSTVDNAQGRQAVSSATAKIAKDVTEKDFDRGNFPASAKVDNSWYPLVPGTQYILEGRANRGEGLQDRHRELRPRQVLRQRAADRRMEPARAGRRPSAQVLRARVGNVRVGAVADPEAEELVLVKVSRLNPPTLAEARAEALKLEKHADTVSRNLYGQTLPAN
jgi:hypothetical protein